LVYFKCSLLVLVLAYSIPQGIAGIISHFQTTKRFGIKLHAVPFFEILKYLKSSFVLFLSTIAGTITITLSVILLGFLSTEESVGYFAVASKLVSVMYGIVLFPFQIVFFPIIVRNVKKSYDSGIRYFVKVLMGSLTIMGLCCGIIYLYSPLIIKAFGGNNFEPSIECLKIVCFIPFLALADTLFGFLLVALNKSLTYTTFLLIGTAICFLLNLIFIPSLGAVGASLAWLFAEFGSFLCFSISFLKKDFSAVYGLNAVRLKTINIFSYYGSKISSKRKVS
jgi:O-antigen/teichoic acid export membrane protein